MPRTNAAPPVGRWRRRLGWAWLAIVLCAVAYDGWAWFIDHRLPETDILALLPSEDRDPAVREALRRVTDAAQQHLVVLVGDRDWERAKRAADAYRGVLARYPAWFHLDRTVETGESGALAPWWSHRSMLLSEGSRLALQRATPDAWTRTALRNLSSPLGMGRIGAWQDDPFGLFRDWLEARASLTPVRPVDGVLRVDDDSIRYVVLPVTLEAAAYAFRAAQAVVPVLDEARHAAAIAAPDSRALTAGAVLFAAAASEQAQRELAIIGWGSMLGILFLLWLVLRSLRPLALVALSLGVGTLGALAVCTLLFSKLHLITLVFGASLVGVAEDYGINYLCTRIDRGQDAWSVMRGLLPGLTLALLTTVVAYLGLALTPFPGLRQMAAFAAVGLMFAWVTVVLWFPPLQRRAPSESRIAEWFGATRARWPVRRLDRTTVAIGTGVAIVIAAGVARLTTNDDVRLLQNAPPVLLSDQRDISRILHAPSPAQFFVVRADSEAALLAREEELRVKLDSLVARGTLPGYSAVSLWIPSPARQQRDAALIAGKLYGAAGPLDRLASALGEDQQWLRSARQRAEAPVAPLRVADWIASPLSAPYRHLWLGRPDGRFASVVALQGVTAANLSALRDLAAGAAGVTWVDKVSDISALMGRYRREMGWVVMISYLAIWLLLLPRYGRSAWRVLAPSILASLVALAVFGFLGEPLQLFHVLALLMIFGSGVDYAIFLRERPGRRERDTWVAVGLSAASTLLSFGLLGLSGTPALRTFGVTMLIGVTVAALTAPYFCSDR